MKSALTLVFFIALLLFVSSVSSAKTSKSKTFMRTSACFEAGTSCTADAKCCSSKCSRGALKCLN